MVGQASRVALFAAATLAALPSAAETFTVRGACRDGTPHGVYELAMPDGKLRVLGAFNRGKRTGSFLYWTSAGARIAHVPYDEDVISGTLALWHARAAPGVEPRQKLEAAYTAGALNGAKRSWYANGRPRSEYAYENGTLVTAKAWNALGAPLTNDAARALADRDQKDDERYYATLDAIVNANPPACEAATNAVKS